MIFIEVIITRLRKKDYYRLNDSINSLSMGMLSISSGILTKVIEVAIYTTIFSIVAIFELSTGDWWVWLLAWFAYDLCFYWGHRKGHEINILWAAHVIHHQSEEYNLTTALRQSSSKFLLGWIFYIPLAIIGIPPIVFFTVGLVNLLYQFWVHTRHVPKLGWYELFFVTPSNHRVHHAKNRKYLDKNYGGVFIIWDRIFGTFQEEQDEGEYEPIRYGTLKPLRSWNPIWANFQIYQALWADAKATGSWKEKFTLWFRKTGYRPVDVTKPMKFPDIHGYKNYNPVVSNSLTIYAGIQFFILMIATTSLMATYHLTPGWQNTLSIAVIALNLLMIGWLLEKPQKTIKLETTRFSISLAALILVSLKPVISPLPLIVGLAIALPSLLIIHFTGMNRDVVVTEEVQEAL
nr:sterol desaturase family protein [Endozoicomonas sp. OPT23]